MDDRSSLSGMLTSYHTLVAFMTFKQGRHPAWGIRCFPQAPPGHFMSIARAIFDISDDANAMVSSDQNRLGVCFLVCSGAGGEGAALETSE